MDGALVAQCPACAAPVSATDRYCETCGHHLAASPPGETNGTRHAVSTKDSLTCPGCGANAFGPEGYCDTCGQRPTTGPDHAEADLGDVAGVTDVGLRRRHNEDAMGLGVLPGGTVAVVCDGVSSSTRADAAANAAVSAATPLLLDELRRGVSAARAIESAARAAQQAAAGTAGPVPDDVPPCCTFVCATVLGGRITVGWVGDSRAYWLPREDADHGAVCLTTDDSLAGRFAAGEISARAVPDGPQARALTRWLGADAGDTTPHLLSFTPGRPGWVLVCSDGLSMYCPTPADLAGHLSAVEARADPAGPVPLAVARGLVEFALACGGGDNVTAVLIPVPSATRPSTSAPAPPDPSGGQNRG